MKTNWALFTLILVVTIALPGKSATAQLFPEKPSRRLGYGEIAQIQYSPDGKVIAAATPFGVRLFKADSLEELALWGEGPVLSVAFSLDGTLLASGSYGDAPIRLWEVATGVEKTTLGDPAVVGSIAFSPDGKLLASSDTFFDSTIRLWEVATGVEKIKLGEQSDIEFAGITSLVFSPNGNLLASSSWNGTVGIWEVATGVEKARLRGASVATSVAFSPDGALLARGSLDSIITLWDVATRIGTATHSGYASGVASVAFSPDGRLLAAGLEDNTVLLWDVSTRTEKATLRGPADFNPGFHCDHCYMRNSVAFSPDGTRLAAGSWDKTIRLWEVSTGVEKAALPGHGASVRSVAFSPDGGCSFLAPGIGRLSCGTLRRAQKRRRCGGMIILSLPLPSAPMVRCWLRPLARLDSGTLRPGQKERPFRLRQSRPLRSAPTGNCSLRVPGMGLSESGKLRRA